MGFKCNWTRLSKEMIVCLLPVLVIFISYQNIVAYMLFAMALFYFFTSIAMQKWCVTEGIVFILFMSMVLMQIIGLVPEFLPYGIRCVGGTFCVMIFCLLLMQTDKQDDKKWYFVKLWAIIIPVYVITLSNLRPDLILKYQNLISGTCCFLYCMFIYLLLCDSQQMNRGIFGCILVLDMISLLITKGRTGLLVFTFVIVINYILNGMSLRFRKFKVYFILFVLCLFVGLTIYCYIDKFGFYDQINYYSEVLFNKNINSGRPALWKNELSRINVDNMLLGIGTGTLPTMERYIGTSFHNSFIQMIIQNGVVFFCVFLLLIYYIVCQFERKKADPAISFCYAVVLGCMLYNCFETTLLQNKISIGIVQWAIIALGIARCKE